MQTIRQLAMFPHLSTVNGTATIKCNLAQYKLTSHTHHHHQHRNVRKRMSKQGNISSKLNGPQCISHFCQTSQAKLNYRKPTHGLTIVMTIRTVEDAKIFLRLQFTDLQNDDRKG
uniref:Uncharacterized protein n=1 Tax=Glossina pallidipes TaxID=7398 RepID=A0A1A9ZJX3_GLOPL